MDGYIRQGKDSQRSESRNRGTNLPRERSQTKESLEENLYDHGISSGINFQNYKDIPIKITGSSCPRRITSFSEAQLADLLMTNITKSHYTISTPIQEHSTRTQSRLQHLGGDPGQTNGL